MTETDTCCWASDFGCCPDNKTAMTSENDTCCSSSEYGCCPDNMTAKVSSDDNCGIEPTCD